MRTTFLCLVLAVVSASSLVVAGPREELRRARREFVQGRFGDAVRTLRSLLYPEVRLAKAEEILAARELLGVAHVLARDLAAAREEFERLLLEVSPDHRLDGLVYPPDVIALFDKLRDELAEKRAAARARMVLEAKRIEDERRRKREELERERLKRREFFERRVEVKSPLVNLIPFGAGQFQNRRSGKGVAFLVTQALALGANIASYVAIEGLRGADGRFTAQDAQKAKSFQAIQFSALAVFAALVVYGVIDGFADFKGSDVTIRKVPAFPDVPSTRTP